MQAAAMEFLAAVETGQKPKWLSFCGGSGVGKTFLAFETYMAAATLPEMLEHETLVCGAKWAPWMKILTKLRSGRYALADELIYANILFLDEIAIEHDPSGYAKDALMNILGQRTRKWTILTSNYSIERIGQIDERLSSRMIRDGSVMVDCDTIDYAERS